MDINKRELLLAGAVVGAGLAATQAAAQGRATRPINSGRQPSSVDMTYKPRRLN